MCIRDRLRIVYAFIKQSHIQNDVINMLLYQIRMEEMCIRDREEGFFRQVLFLRYADV